MSDKRTALELGSDALDPPDYEAKVSAVRELVRRAGDVAHALTATQARKDERARTLDDVEAKLIAPDAPNDYLTKRIRQLLKELREGT